MPIRNFWSLEVGEVLTAQAIQKQLKDVGVDVYFPLRDTGIDLLVTKGKKIVTIQVKESRYFQKRFFKGSLGHSWHQVHERKFLRDREKLDFYVFLTYLPKIGEHKVASFEEKYLIVPTLELEKLIQGKKTGTKKIYSFYFNFGEEVIEKRDEVTNYSKYLNNWDLIEKALAEQSQF